MYAMYDPRDPPYVTHERGTELVIEHIERLLVPFDRRERPDCCHRSPRNPPALAQVASAGTEDMQDEADLCQRLRVKRVLNAMGVPTILGANTVSQDVRSSVDGILQVSVEIDELQAAACRVISRHTGAEAGCVTSSCSAALAISAAAAMTGSDLAAIARLPDTDGVPDQVVLPLAHDVNFGAPISQMIRISGAEVVHVGTAQPIATDFTSEVL